MKDSFREYAIVDKGPISGWRVVWDKNDPEDNGSGRYYCPYIPDCVPLEKQFPFVRNTNHGTQVKMREEDEWVFFWDLPVEND